MGFAMLLMSVGAIETAESVDEALDCARRENRLALVIHISGDFRDEGRT